MVPKCRFLPSRSKVIWVSFACVRGLGTSDFTVEMSLHRVKLSGLLLNDALISSSSPSLVLIGVACESGSDCRFNRIRLWRFCDFLEVVATLCGWRKEYDLGGGDAAPLPLTALENDCG